MKILLILILTVLGYIRISNAAPYFHVFDPAHIYKSVGAYIDPVDSGNTAFGTPIALITHSTRDGCLLPSIVCEDWSPLMAGFSVNAGRLSFNAGPAINLMPTARGGLLYIVNGLTADNQFGGLKSVLAPSDSGVTISFGPALNVDPVQHGVFVPIRQWHGKFRIFAGAALKFQ